MFAFSARLWYTELRAQCKLKTYSCFCQINAISIISFGPLPPIYPSFRFIFLFFFFSPTHFIVFNSTKWPTEMGPDDILCNLFGLRAHPSPFARPPSPLHSFRIQRRGR